MKSSHNNVRSSFDELKLHPKILAWALEGLGEPEEEHPQDYGRWCYYEETEKMIPGPYEHVPADLHPVKKGERLSPTAIPHGTFLNWMSAKLEIPVELLSDREDVLLMCAEDVFTVWAAINRNPRTSRLCLLNCWLSGNWNWDKGECSETSFGDEDEGWYELPRIRKDRKAQRDGYRQYRARSGFRVHKPGPESNGDARAIKRSGAKRRKNTARRLMKQSPFLTTMESDQREATIVVSFTEL